MVRTGSRSALGLRSPCLRCGLVLALPAVLLWHGGFARAQAKKSDSVVKVEASADRPDKDGKQTVTVTLDIEKPWHVYANPVGNEDLTGVQTDVHVHAARAPQSVRIEYPAGKDHGEKDEKHKIYEGKVVIKAHVRRDPRDNGPLFVSVKFQSCTDRQCLLPATVRVPVR